MPKSRKTSHKRSRKTSRKTSHKQSRNRSHRRGKKISTAYVGKYKKSSGRRWVKHDILTKFSSSQHGDAIKNNNQRGYYEDPISFEEIKEGEDVICLGDGKYYYCYKVDTITEWLNQGKTTDPITGKEIEKYIINHFIQPYRVGVLEYGRDKVISINADFNGNPNIIFNDKNNAFFEDKLVRRIFFGRDFNQSIEGVKFPEGVKEIRFGDRFNQPIDLVKFPDSLRIIEFGSDFNQSIKNVNWPERLEDIKFGDSFNQPIGGSFFSPGVKFPENIQGLTFGRDFNQPIKNVKFPENLGHIVFGEKFNQPINEVKWPNKYLAHFEFGSDFKQPVDKVKWPESIYEIYFSRNYNNSSFDGMWKAAKNLKLAKIGNLMYRRAGTYHPEDDEE